MRKHRIEESESFPSKEAEPSIDWKDALKEAFVATPQYAIFLKGMRNREGWTQVQLAEKIGVTQSDISKMEHGQRSIGKNIAKRLAEIFETDYRLFL